MLFAVDKVWAASDGIPLPGERLPLQPAATIRLRWCYGGQAGRGKPYHTIIRALASKWICILFRCWQNRTPYHEAHYLQDLKRRGSIHGTLQLAEES